MIRSIWDKKESWAEIWSPIGQGRTQPENPEWMQKLKKQKAEQHQQHAWQHSDDSDDSPGHSQAQHL